MRVALATSFVFIVLAVGAAVAQEPGPDASRAPFTVVTQLFDASLPDTLGLVEHPGAETFTVFRPGDGDNTFNHGAVITKFKELFYVQWQTSQQDEDSPDTHVVYSTSRDGRAWTEPRKLVTSPPGSMTTSGGWWLHDGQLIAYINVWPRAGEIKHGGMTMYVSSRDGASWTELQPVTDKHDRPVSGVFEQDPEAMPNGRIISAFHLQPGLNVAPHYTDDPAGLRGWTRGKMENLSFDGPISREIEPSWFMRNDGAIVMVFRDQAETFLKLASVSHDDGETWSPPVLTNMPDSRSKQSAGNLPDGTAFLVGNPVTSKLRFPLVVALSRDGKVFDRAWLLRRGGRTLPEMRYDGRYKRQGFSYPKSAVIGDWLYIAYATNKEDIEVTRVPVDSLYPSEM